MRSEHAIVASFVALGTGSDDPHHPKAVRASTGAVFAVALTRVSEIAELPGVRVALSADAADALRGADGSGVSVPEGDGLTLLVGAEREGLPPDVIAACERAARIPISSEALNAAV